MQRQTVFLVTSDECGWADVRQALKKLPDVSVLEQSSVRNARQAIADCSPGLLLVSPDIARTLLGDQEDGGLPEMDRRLRIAIIGSEPVPMDVLQQAHFELAGRSYCGTISMPAIYGPYSRPSSIRTSSWSVWRSPIGSSRRCILRLTSRL